MPLKMFLAIIYSLFIGQETGDEHKSCFIQTSRKPWNLIPGMKRSSEQTLRAFARNRGLLALVYLLYIIFEKALIVKLFPN